MPLSKVLELRFPLTSATADLVLQVIDYPQMRVQLYGRFSLCQCASFLNNHVISVEYYMTCG